MTIRQIGIALAAFEPEPTFFEAQLESIQKQSFTQWQCLISSDSLLQSFRENPTFQKFFNDPRFIWRENPTRLGSKKNFECAIQLLAKNANIDAIACSDQDDIWYPEKLETCACELEKRGPLALVHSDMHILNAQGSIAEQTAWKLERRGVHHTSLGDLLIRNVIAGCSMLLDANLARQYPTIPEAFDYHDHWYAAVASAHGGIFSIHRPLYAYRQHGKNVLGITPFAGLLSLRGQNHPLAVLKKLKTAWTGTLMRVNAAQDAGLLNPKTSETLFLNRLDFGMPLICKAWRDYPSDPALARACLARAMGKVVTFGRR